MKRLKFLIIPFFIFTQISNAQNDYYKNTDNLYGKKLQMALYSIIKGQTKLPYSSSSPDVWDALKQTDKDTTNSSDVILFYTGWKRNAAKEYDNGNGWNREHVWPKSHGFPDKADTAYTDINHLRPADVSVNSARGSKDFDNGGSEYIDPDGDTGCKTDEDSWEPRDAVKGDVARMIFYMATRYEGFQGYDLQIVDYTGTSGSKLGKLSTLIKWNRLDPPSDYERHRNDVVFSIQHNRNPFIDRPEFADRIYLTNNLLIEKAEAVSKNTVLVTFNKDLDSSTAAEPSNYFIDKGIGNPTSVEPFYNGVKNTVLLRTKEFTDNTSYVLKISGVTSGGAKIADGSIAGLNVKEPTKVEFNLFSANIINRKVKLTWSTVSEENCLGFEIERKNLSGTKWRKIAFVSHKGSAISGADYLYYDDPQFNTGNYFYRLKSINVDGSYSYSSVASVNTGMPYSISLSQNYPNPVCNGTKTNFEFKIPSRGIVTLKIYNILGQEISTVLSSHLTAGRYNASFSVKNLSAGIYFYRLTIRSDNLQAGEKSLIKKMTILK